MATNARHESDARSSVNDSGFAYGAAFDRNIGWITEWEQQRLRTRTVAIAGLGGVGGAHALTLARLGIGGLHIADLDRFDVVNLNRQAGAFVSTIGQEKADVTARMVQDINPELRLEVFDEGVNDANIDEFLSGVDLFVDGLDFFAIGIRRTVFRRCAELGIPAITAAPIGFGSSYLIFMPGGMTFEDYFRLEGLSEERQYVNFALGLTPKGFHRTYLVDPSRLDLGRRRGPSTAAAIQLCAGIVGAEAVKILLGRGKVRAAPWYHQFDAYRGKWKRGRLVFGNAGPVQGLKRQIGYRAFAALSRQARPAEEPATGSDIERILDLARWAPSGDNSQPWRFKIEGDTALIRIERPEDDIYDYDGRPTLLSAGMLLETARIAATGLRRSMAWSYVGGDAGTVHQISVEFPLDRSVSRDPLIDYIALRSVDRRPYKLGRLTSQQKTELATALGEGVEVSWHESPAARWRETRLNRISTAIRLRSPDAYRVHQRVIDWSTAFSRAGIPAKAVGLDALTLKIMRWSMQSWRRTSFLNRFLFGALAPQLQLDVVPGLASAAHFTVGSRPDPGDRLSPQSLLTAGAAIQRFWLTATRLGLAVQPALSPIIFAHHARTGGALPDGRATRHALGLARELSAPMNGDLDRLVFRGRIGKPIAKPVGSRSIRRTLSHLVRP